METGPRFRYYLSDTEEVLEDNRAVWNAPIPMQLKKFSPPKNQVYVTYGEYFKAARRFLEKDDFRAINSATLRRRKHTVKPESISSLDIHLEKHGPFYHPARIRVDFGETYLQCVLNVAVSDAGNRTIKREYTILEKLNADYPFRFLPETYHLDDNFAGTEPPRRQQNISMFLGEWFDGFHEFHISGKTADGRCITAVWDPSQGKVEMTADQALMLYQKAAMILTCYFNPETSEQIFPWFHAAGDFVVRIENGTPELKLVTVRQYGPFVKNDDAGLQDILEAMLAYLLNLTLWTRIDRLDGVGDLVWADKRAVKPTLTGFYEGLSLQTTIHPMIEPLSVAFRAYLSSQSETALYDLSSALVDTCHPDKPEVPLFRKHLKAHVAHLHTIVKTWKN